MRERESGSMVRWYQDCS